ncbi:MAG: glycosyltransferase family 2 protein [Gammaproteobacteria bacterium]|nr:MAG: glycosyltransferase family 2 protein [Gammaproteobacteria bacterium]
MADVIQNQYCVVIPIYNHEQFIESTLERIFPFDLPIIIVNDGSRDECVQVLNSLQERYDVVDVLHQPQNGGKGAAVIAGLKKAYADGYKYAVQIDADGQHDIEKLDELLAVSKGNPDALVTAVPVYDESVPKGRLIARYITHVWVWINTLSFAIKDSMCGYRVYPLNVTCDLLQRVKLGLRMDFDIEILVRLYWRDVIIKNLPMKVIYHDDGISHFNAVQDNILISRMHARLFFGMLIRSPKLLFRKFLPNRAKGSA